MQFKATHLIALVIIGLIGSCRSGPPGRVVILITVDSLRADHLGVYGHPGDISPHIDELAAQATRYTRAFSNCSWTKPAMVSMLTGLIPSHHLVVSSALQVHLRQAKLAAADAHRQALYEGIIDNFDRATRIPERLPLFHESLDGFKKAAFLNNPHLHEHYGFNRGWDHFVYYPSKAFQQGKISAVTPTICRDVLEFLDRHAQKDVFIWIHTNDVHYPYGPADKTIDEFYFGPRIPLEKYDIALHERLAGLAQRDETARDMLHALYRAGIKEFDTHLGDFFKALRDRNRWDSSMIVLTADHGEEFMEHGSMGHGFNLFNTTLWIPLLVKAPYQATAKIDDGFISLLDMGPLILDRVEHGDAASEKGALPSHAPFVAELLSVELAHQKAVVAPGVKLIYDVHADVIERYDLARDFDETLPKGASHSDPLFEFLLGRVGSTDIIDKLEHAGDGVQATPEAHEELLEDLRSLGYIQ